MIAVAKELHLAPSVAACELREDPERLALRGLPLLRFAEAYGDIRRYEASQSEEKPGRPSDPIHELVDEVSIEVAEEDVAAVGAEEIEGDS